MIYSSNPPPVSQGNSYFLYREFSICKCSDLFGNNLFMYYYVCDLGGKLKQGSQSRQPVDVSKISVAKTSG